MKLRRKKRAGHIARMININKNLVRKLHFKRKTGEPGSKLKVKIKTISLLEK
jgi:hypothetical protein